MAATAELPAGDVDPMPRTQMVATSLVVAAGTVLVSGMLGIYLSFRDRVENPGSAWVPFGADIPNAPMAMALTTALLSSFTAQWAVSASRRGERAHTYTAIGITLVFGLAWINILIFSFNQLDVGLGSSQWANLVYAHTGLAVALVIIACVYLGLMGVRSLGGDLGPSASAPLAAAALFWHFTVVAFSAIWYVVFVVK